MKDIITFPIMGYQPQEVRVGDILRLERDLESLDPHAIKIFLGNVFLGYVPNRGLSCSFCWEHVAKEAYFCPKCEASYEYFSEGGLATRLIMTKSLERNHACYLETLEEDKLPFCKLILE